jgi:hypothetical protein
MNTHPGHLKQFYPITFLLLRGAHPLQQRDAKSLHGTSVFHFFLDFKVKQPYKGDTTALSLRVAQI